MTIGSVPARNAVLQAVFGDNRAAGIPSILYLAFYNGDPTAGGTEITDIARVAVSMASSMWSVSGGDAVSQLTVTTAAGAWSQPGTHVALLDNAAHSAGNLWHYGALSSSVQPTGPGDVVAFAPGNLSIHQL